MKTTLEKNTKLIEDYFNEVWNAGKIDKLDEIITHDYINHSPGTPNPMPGPGGLKPIIVAMRTGFPDLHYQIRDLVITEDKIVARTIMTGTHKGELWGMQPTNNKVEINQINIEHLRDGKISEHWRVSDELKMMKDLGIIK